MQKKIELEKPAVAASGPTAPVPKDPQPTVDRIEELARRILNGDILLPKFQRRFVWGRGQILVLLDSVARGYPIGSVLLWQSRQELRNENNIADLNITLPKPDYPVNYLLDGQQRLSVICGALFWKGTDPKSLWNITYDLKVEKFLHMETIDDPPLHQIRVNKLSDAAAFFKHVASLDTLTAPDKGDLKTRAELLFNRFKDYKIATVTLGDMSIKDVAPIFERINSTGTPLTIVDLMRAATWRLDFDLVDSIEGILSELAVKGFGDIDKKVLLRSLSASAGGGFSAESIDQLRDHEPEKLKTAVVATKDAYKRMVDFLVTTIRISDGNVVPYVNQLTVLGEIFRLIPNPTAVQYQAITSWFWKTALSGYFGGWNTGMMSTDLLAVQKFSQGKTATIDISLTRPAHDIWKVRQFRTNNAHAKVLAIALAHHHPVDLLTGQPIDITKALSWSNVKEYHHVFPQSYLKGLGVSANKINCLANIMMLTSVSNKVISDRAPSSYFKDVMAFAGGNLQNWLARNLISPEAFNAAMEDKFEDFLELRAQTIHAEVTGRTDWQEV